MFDVMGFTKDQISAAKTVMVQRVEDNSRHVSVFCFYFVREKARQDDGSMRMQQVRHEHTVSWDKTINPCLDLKNSLWCDCVNCSLYEVKTRKWCRCKLRAAQELINREIWPKMIERYLYGDCVE